MANSVDTDQTAPIGAVCSGSTLFASILNLSVMLGNYLQQTTSADDIFRCIFFLGALRVKTKFFHGSKQYEPRSDCSQGSSLIKVHIVCNIAYQRTEAEKREKQRIKVTTDGIRVNNKITPDLEVIKLEFILRHKIKHNDWVLADTCPQAANHCALF